MDKNGKNKQNKKCSVCKSILGTANYKGVVLCGKHQMQIRKHGAIQKRTLKDLNSFRKCGSYTKIFLYNKNCEKVAEAKIDNEDLEKVKHIKWGFRKEKTSGYARCDKFKQTLHLFLLGKRDGLEIDHINRDKLDNRKANLRFVSRSQNTINRRDFQNIDFYKQTNKWRARIGYKHKSITLGYFKTKEDAQKARREAELKYYGF